MNNVRSCYYARDTGIRYVSRMTMIGLLVLFSHSKPGNSGAEFVFLHAHSGICLMCRIQMTRRNRIQRDQDEAVYFVLTSSHVYTRRDQKETELFK
jgi:hypothetical protein